MARDNSVIELYQDKKREWRWRLKAKNGKVIADSAEGYKERRHAFRMANKLEDYACEADVYEVKK